MVDVFSDFVFLRALKSKQTSEIAAVILMICADFGYLSLLQCDN